MRQTHETATTSFNQLKEITQSIQAYQALTQGLKPNKPTKKGATMKPDKKLNRPLEKRADRFEWALIIAFSLILATAYALRSFL